MVNLVPMESSSPETQKALANLLNALVFATIILTVTVAFRLLPPDISRFIQERLSDQPQPRAAPNAQINTLDNRIHTASTHTHPTSPQRNNDLPSPPILRASSHTNDHKHHLLLAATGSVATIKIPNILRALSHHANLSTRVILSSSATEFLQGQSAEQPSLSSLLREIPNLEAIYLDRDEWVHAWTRNAPILHIELRRWADLMLVAPVSANALAKLALGMSDDLVSSVARAWDTTGLIDAPRPGVGLPYGEGRDRKGIILAPAMNTAMWEHPITKEHVGKLEGEGWSVGKGGWFEVLRPVEKDLACGDTGSGAMKEWKDIVRIVEERLGLAGGEDEEFIDVKKTK